MRIRQLVDRSLCAAAAVTLVALSGCSEISSGEQVVLRPPRATGDKACIQTIIDEQAGGGYTLKYPQRGDNRSAITMVSSEKGDEYAIALYSTESDSKLNVSIIVNEGGTWSCAGTFSDKGNGVDMLSLYDINNDGKEEVLVGWSSYSSQRNSLSIYSLDNGTAREMMKDEAYNDILVSDITDDKSMELILMTLSNAQSGSALRLLQYSEQEKRPIAKYAADLDPEVTSFAGIQLGKIDTGKKGIVIDGEKAGGQLSTQVVYFDPVGNTLKNPLVTLTAEETYANVTTRREVITSRDFDEDGIIELPVTSQLPASAEDDASSVCSLVSWKQLRTNDDTLQTKLSTVTNYNDGYYFILPEKWTGNVTAITDHEKRETSFFVWNSKTSSRGDKLLTISRYTRSAWKKLDKKGSIKLDIGDGTDAVIAAKLYRTASDDSLNIVEEALSDYIKPIV